MKMAVNLKDLTDEEKKGMIQKAYDLGYQYEQERKSCPQCTLAAVGEVFGFRNEDLFQSVYSLGGGLALTGEGTCGALNAAIMMIGLLHGRGYEGFEKGLSYPECHELAQRVYQRFRDRYGSVICAEVHKKIFDGRTFRLADKEQFKAFEEAGGHDDKCPSVVGSVCRMVAEMILSGEI